MTMPKEAGHRTLACDPWLDDPSLLHITLQEFRHETLEHKNVIEHRVIQTHEFLITEAVDFINTVVP